MIFLTFDMINNFNQATIPDGHVMKFRGYQLIVNMMSVEMIRCFIN